MRILRYLDTTQTLTSQSCSTCVYISGVSGNKRLCCLQESPSWSVWWMISLCTWRTRACSTVALSPNCWKTTGVLVEIFIGHLHTIISADLFSFVFVIRSHPAILKIPNELFYDGELQVCADEFLRNSYCRWEYLPKKVTILLSAHIYCEV